MKQGSDKHYQRRNLLTIRLFGSTTRKRKWIRKVGVELFHVDNGCIHDQKQAKSGFSASDASRDTERAAFHHTTFEWEERVPNSFEDHHGCGLTTPVTSLV